MGWLTAGQNVSDPVEQYGVPATAHVAKFQEPGFEVLVIWDNGAAFNAANYPDVPVGTVVYTFLAGSAAVNVKEDDGTWTAF